ncbi:MAG: T9SS type A sorting domain-containing protein [Paludibacteraceae bacterium]|nr:T9SS type A sorting domain-containing protein [Paludibacteraceae bacterium]
MKITKQLILVAALCMLPSMLSARWFEQGEKLYINSDQTIRDGNGKFNWSDAGANLVLYVWKKGKTNSQQWVTLTKESNNLWVGDMPAGDFDGALILRKSGSANMNDFGNVWDRTGDMTITDAADRNYINIFYKDGETSDWLTYVPSAAKVAPYAASLRSANKEEQVVVCPSAMGGPFSLRVKLKSDKSAYDYDNVQCHGWFRSTDGSTWTSVDDYAGMARNGEQDKVILKNNLPVSGVVYYYLHSAKTAGRRLIKVTTEGAKDCELDCSITAFEVATSAVNANDTTYTLDGMVAFGEPNGKLVITCNGKSTTIDSPKSPQVFSIPGLRGATTGGKTAVATATFTGNSGCKAEVQFDVPNVTQGIVSKHIDVLVGETAELNPSGADYANKHVWYIDGKEQTTMQGKQSSTAYDEANVTRYTYREFNPPAGDMSDMMSNGSYEEEFNYGVKGETSTISDYNFWGKYAQTDNTAIDFYTNTAINPAEWSDNGFAVVKNANNFFYTFAKIKAREGSYFAMFDAASDGVAGKKAWKAETAKNPNLKLQKGTTYLFSFWAANINNYGEMDNAAKLQFHIEYNGKTQQLGEVLDLGSAEFRNNRWHQCSATFKADADASNVTISVVNLNTNELNTGNDFALDDIQFRAVSSATRSVRIQQVFEVQTHEPHVFTLAATAQPMDCDQTDYTVSLTVTYDNPKGKLVIKDMTTDHVLFNEAVPAVGADWDKKKTKTIAVKVEGMEPVEHRYKAYFDEWEKSYAEAVSTAPQFSSCCVEGVLYSKWDNVLFVSNAGNVYKAYQWYKNDKKLQGETKQRYYTGSTAMSGTSDTYYCEVTRQDGTVEKTCSHTFDECPRSAERAAVEDIAVDGVAVYPTQVAAGTAVTVSKTCSGDVRANVLTMTGQVVSTTTISTDVTPIVMPQAAGLYLLQLQGSTTKTTIKIHVY